MRGLIGKLLGSSLVVYGLVGVANTCVGLGLCLLLTFLGLVPEVANLLGNIAGVINSYFLNKKFTFKSKNSHKQDAWRFGVAMGIAYLANLATLSISHRICGVDVYIAQILASVVYTIVGYFISKFWAFKTSQHQDFV
ncbi:GtrA family protein [Helicobacter sp. 23-1046]